MEDAGLLSGGFSFQRFEKPTSKHVGCGLDHALAHAGDEAADVDVSGVLDFSCAVCVFQIEFAGAFYESRLAFAFHDELVVLRGDDFLKRNGGGEDAFYRADSGGELGFVLIVAGFFHLLTAGNALLQDGGINQRGKDAVTRGVDFLGAFNLHGKPLTTKDTKDHEGFFAIV